MKRMVLRDALRNALERALPWGWIHVPEVEPLTLGSTMARARERTRSMDAEGVCQLTYCVDKPK